MFVRLDGTMTTSQISFKCSVSCSSNVPSIINQSIRSSHPEMFFWNVLRKYAANLQETQQLYWNHISTWVFSFKLDIFRTPFSKNTSGWLLLEHGTIIQTWSELLFCMFFFSFDHFKVQKNNLKNTNRFVSITESVMELPMFCNNVLTLPCWILISSNL